MSPTGGLTTVEVTKWSTYFDANTGRHWVESTTPLKPLAIRFSERGREVRADGNKLYVRQRFQTSTEFRETVETLYFSLPLLLAVEFMDSPTITRVGGTIGDNEFRWELTEWIFDIDVTSQAKQEERVRTAFSALDTLLANGNRRLLGAYYYFHVASRLRREAGSPGEFLAEAILNLSKILEVLFGSNRDRVRNALRELGYSSDEIERDFIPIMCLRNSLDVGHPTLATFTREQLDTLQQFADQSELAFRKFLRQLLGSVVAGKVQLPRYEEQEADKSTARTIEIIRERSLQQQSQR